MSEKPPPLLRDKHYDEESIFSPQNLLREARRQKNVPLGDIPAICLLDPDGDILTHVIERKGATPNPHWACYHTRLYEFSLDERRVGIIGQAVGASFAVLLAEQLFASGCQLLFSVTSAGQLVKAAPTPYFVLIDKALRDEGTSYHYLPPAEYAQAPKPLLDKLSGAFRDAPVQVLTGGAWTTDAPYRETASAVHAATERGLMAVEMEAAALYAFAQAQQRDVMCFAHVTNQMAVAEGDFEKGEDAGSRDALRVLALAISALAAARPG